MNQPMNLLTAPQGAGKTTALINAVVSLGVREPMRASLVHVPTQIRVDHMIRRMNSFGYERYSLTEIRNDSGHTVTFSTGSNPMVDPSHQRGLTQMAIFIDSIDAFPDYTPELLLNLPHHLDLVTCNTSSWYYALSRRKAAHMAKNLAKYLTGHKNYDPEWSMETIIKEVLYLSISRESVNIQFGKLLESAWIPHQYLGQHMSAEIAHQHASNFN